jgi:hypothetical protein
MPCGPWLSAFDISILFAGMKINMTTIRFNLHIATIWVFLLVLLTLAACGVQPDRVLLLVTPAQTGAPCEACAQATLAAALTQQRNDADNQAAAAAEIVRANAQATFNSANATLSAVQTQQQSDANVIAAQIAATAEIARANAQATLNSAGSTQSAALTQDAIRHTQMADLATTGAQAVANKQYKDELAASTQTAVANSISTQAQVAAATSQQYARQREEQRQGPISFLWMWCLPMFIVLLAGLVLWGVWRRLTIQQANQRILEKPADRLPALPVEVPHHHHVGSSSYLDSDVANDGYQVTNPDDQVEKWLDEVKDKLLDRDEKDKDDKTNS